MLTITNADLNNPTHATDLVHMLNMYALDPMGGNEALSDYAQANLIKELKQRNTVRAILAYVDDQAAGFAICIEGFSTFACKPLLNIHDFAVHPDFRGQGVAQGMMQHLSTLSRELGYCKMTLEVLEGNTRAQNLYRAEGFAPYELNPEFGGAIIMQKKIVTD
ncbi:GNAT family N-acetyltransferase [Undibacterium sp. CY18W]|uniref:GNAT family N-acetyltransferase n=1 Tax=Undibacterium hunanense TaxID=2762292 RepID=A0ABR6ZZ21_9BURK|nr:GNAT family N-acetyltransferase [Undibacterium hunanense]MBC3921102.1 GNAT family N-acetyltransferase [Undibacterium hunanense]